MTMFGYPSGYVGAEQDYLAAHRNSYHGLSTNSTVDNLPSQSLEYHPQHHQQGHPSMLPLSNYASPFTPNNSNNNTSNQGQAHHPNPTPPLLPPYWDGKTYTSLDGTHQQCSPPGPPTAYSEGGGEGDGEGMEGEHRRISPAPISPPCYNQMRYPFCLQQAGYPGPLPLPRRESSPLASQQQQPLPQPQQQPQPQHFGGYLGGGTHLLPPTAPMMNTAPPPPHHLSHPSLPSGLHMSSMLDPNGGVGGVGGPRRKNATRETTATLKAWLQEHVTNPYPTKGEKIMLAIITKMTFNQVSTWFANARRRLKKENKMTWSPKTGSGGEPRPKVPELVHSADDCSANALDDGCSGDGDDMVGARKRPHELIDQDLSDNVQGGADDDGGNSDDDHLLLMAKRRPSQMPPVAFSHQMMHSSPALPPRLPGNGEWMTMGEFPTGRQSEGWSSEFSSGADSDLRGYNPPPPPVYEGNSAPFASYHNTSAYYMQHPHHLNHQADY